MQIYISYPNGAVYNEICEFDFWDDKTGRGYYYLVNAEGEEETTEETTEEATETKEEENETMTTTKETTEKLAGMICRKHTGKMAEMQSLSTACTLNPYCMERAKDPALVCSHCYSMAQQKRYKSLTAKLERNTEILTGEVYPVEAWPRVNAAVFRLESFGDLANETQAMNYFNFCRRNPETTFALWTKNPFIIARVLASGAEKPENLIIIFSSPCLNKPNAAIMDRFPFIDKVFTVYDKEHAANVEINCGARNCNECRRCYSKRTAAAVNELLK